MEVTITIGILGIISLSATSVILNLRNSLKSVNYKFDQISALDELKVRTMDPVQCNAVFAGTKINNTADTSENAASESVDLAGKVLGGVSLNNYVTGGIKLKSIDLKLISTTLPEVTHKAYIHFVKANNGLITPPLNPKFIIIKSQLDAGNNITSCIGLESINSSNFYVNGAKASVRHVGPKLDFLNLPVGGSFAEAKIEKGLPYIRYKSGVAFTAWDQTDYIDLGPFITSGIMSSPRFIRVTSAGLFVRYNTDGSSCGDYEAYLGFSPWGQSLPTPVGATIYTGFGSDGNCGGGGM